MPNAVAHYLSENLLDQPSLSQRFLPVNADGTSGFAPAEAAFPGTPKVIGYASLNSATFTNIDSPSNLNTTGCRQITIWSTCDVHVFVSFDGGTTSHVVVPPGGVYDPPLAALGLKISGMTSLKLGGTATAGSVYISRIF